MSMAARSLQIAARRPGSTLKRVVPATTLAANEGWRRPAFGAFAATATTAGLESHHGVLCSKRRYNGSATAAATVTADSIAHQHAHSTTTHLHLHHHEAAVVAATPSPSSSGETSSSSSNSFLVQQSPDEILKEHNMTRDDLMKFANTTAPTPLRLADMYKACSSDGAKGEELRLRNAQFLHKELPIRTAHRAAELLTLPHGLSNTHAVQQVAATYISHLFTLQAAPVPNTREKEREYTQLLQSLILDRASIPMSLARGMSSWNESLQQHSSSDSSDQEKRTYVQQQNDVEDALYRFFTARVGLRFLIEHFVLSAPRTSDNMLDTQALQNTTSLFPSPNNNNVNNNKDVHQSEDDENGNLRGCIQSNIDLVKEVGKVADLVIQQTMEFYGTCPAIDIVDCVHDDNSNSDNNNTGKDFCYVPNHLHYIMAELLKNSCRATVQRQKVAMEQKKNSATTTTISVLEQQIKNAPSTTALQLPPIRVVIVKGDEDVTIKIADKGGGIPRSRMAKIWRFAHSTADEKEQSSRTFGTGHQNAASTVASDVEFRIRGFGLPLARIYSRYFGGELTLKSMEGYGLDAYLHLPRLGDGGENLPLRVRSSPGARDSMPNKLVSSLSSTSLPSSSSSRNFSSSTTSTNSGTSSSNVKNDSSIDLNMKQAETTTSQTISHNHASMKKAQWQELSCFWELGYYDPQELLTQEIRQCVLQQKQQQEEEKNKFRQYYHANVAAAVAATT